MAIYSATHLIQLVSASAHSLHMSRASCISLGSWNHPFYCLPSGFGRCVSPGLQAELKAREKGLKRSLVAVAVPRRGGENFRWTDLVQRIWSRERKGIRSSFILCLLSGFIKS